MMNSSQFLKVFNDQFDLFVQDLLRVFPENVDILSTKRTFQLLRKTNPKILIIGWRNFVNNKYSNIIISDNDKDIESVRESIFTFFTTKDFAEDLVDHPNRAMIIEGINRLRVPIAEMDCNDQLKVLKYLDNLSKLCDMYHQQNILS